MGNKLLLEMTSGQSAMLRSVKEQTSLSMNELLRRMLDRSLTITVLNEIIPRLSGQIIVEGK